jgi:chromosome segregation ATPase
MIKSKLLVTSAALCAAFSMNAEAKLYKWVDESGTTHYGETIPPEYANKETMKLDKGRLEKREDKLRDEQKKAVELDPVAEKARIEAKRHDDALVNTYSNEKEIDLARDRNLLQVEARINSNTTLLKSAQTTLDELNKERDAIAKQPQRKIPPSLTEDIAAAEERVAKLKKDLETSQKEMDTVKARYESDKQRYRELKGQAPAGAK